MTPKPVLTMLCSLAILAGCTGSLVPGWRSIGAGSASGDERHREASALLDWGRQRFADDGLELPAISLVVHDSLAPCDGRVGRYDEATNELQMCRLDADTVLHELAHAWIDANLDEADRAAFVRLRGVAAWNDRTQPWADRGSEQAAEILVWALADHDKTVRWVDGDTETRRLLSIEDSTPAELAEGFESMVGSPPARRSVERGGTASASFSPEVPG